MAIETFGAINALVATNPTATDNVSEGDDHIRGIKATLQTTFPNVTGAINATETELNYVDGVTSSIQTQLGTKLPLAGGTMTGDVLLGDSVKAKFGAAGDLEVYHDGSNSYINDAGTGTLNLRASSAINLQTPGGAASLASFSESGANTFYYSGAAKLATTSTGIDVTGTAVVDGLTIQGGITEQQVTKSASFTPSFTEGTSYSCSGTMTITMPAATSGKSFTVIAATPPSWAGTIKWTGGAAPAGTGICIYTFISDGTNWYGMEAGNGFA